MKPWKSYLVVAENTPFPLLQWGHGDEAVEEAAKMKRIAPGTSLQWGHGDEAVEEAARIYARPVHPPGLQWGHGDEAVEEEETNDDSRKLDPASMGPRR